MQMIQQNRKPTTQSYLSERERSPEGEVIGEREAAGERDRARERLTAKRERGSVRDESETLSFRVMCSRVIFVIKLF